MVSIIGLLAVYLAVFVLPGALICLILEIRFYKLPVSLVISYFIGFVAIQSYFFVGLSIEAIYLVVYLILSSLLLNAYLRKARYSKFISLDIRGMFSFSWNQLVCEFHLHALLIVFVLIWFTGPFLEIPADVWQHLENIRLERLYFRSGTYTGVNVWYSLLAMVWEFSQASFDEFVFYVSLINQILFLSSIYSIMYFLALRNNFTKTNSKWIGVVSVLFYYLFFGMGEFAYIRYYTFAPGFFAYISYLLVLGLVDEIQNNSGDNKKTYICSAILVLCVALAFVVHKQEFLYQLLVLLFVSTWYVVNNSTGSLLNWIQIKQEFSSRYNLLSVAIFLLVVVLMSIVIIIVRSNFHGIAEPIPLHRDIVNLGELVRSLHGYYVLKIDSQIARVFGIFGVVTVVLWLFSQKRVRLPTVFASSLFVVPLVVFNPAFTSIFFQYSEPEVLWRIGYLIPLPAICSFLLIGNLQEIKRLKAITTGQVLMALLLGTIIASNLFNFPKLEVLKWEKWLTIRPTDANHSHALWSDLILYLNTIDQRKDILTDPITGYVLVSTTHHAHERWKFHKLDYIEFNKPGYSERSFEDYGGWLVIINNRDGPPSLLGNSSGHWSKDILKVSNHYSMEFQRFVSDSSRFQKIWEQNMIAVFLVK